MNANTIDNTYHIGLCYEPDLSVQTKTQNWSTRLYMRQLNWDRYRQSNLACLAGQLYEVYGLPSERCISSQSLSNVLLDPDQLSRYVLKSATLQGAASVFLPKCHRFTMKSSLVISFLSSGVVLPKTTTPPSKRYALKGKELVTTAHSL